MSAKREDPGTFAHTGSLTLRKPRATPAPHTIQHFTSGRQICQSPTLRNNRSQQVAFFPERPRSNSGVPVCRPAGLDKTEHRPDQGEHLAFGKARSESTGEQRMTPSLGWCSLLTGPKRTDSHNECSIPAQFVQLDEAEDAAAHRHPRPDGEEEALPLPPGLAARTPRLPRGRRPRRRSAALPATPLAHGRRRERRARFTPLRGRFAVADAPALQPPAQRGARRGRGLRPPRVAGAHPPRARSRAAGSARVEGGEGEPATARRCSRAPLSFAFVIRIAVSRTMVLALTSGQWLSGNPRIIPDTIVALIETLVTSAFLATPCGVLPPPQVDDNMHVSTRDLGGVATGRGGMGSPLVCWSRPTSRRRGTPHLTDATMVADAQREHREDAEEEAGDGPRDDVALAQRALPTRDPIVDVHRHAAAPAARRRRRRGRGGRRGGGGWVLRRDLGQHAPVAFAALAARTAAFAALAARTAAFAALAARTAGVGTRVSLACFVAADPPHRPNACLGFERWFIKVTNPPHTLEF
eukprot:gene3466-biopygen2303